MRVVLDAKLDSAHADSLAQVFIKAKDVDIELDGSGVEQIGGLCLELLMGVRHLWTETGKSFVLLNPSEQMVDDLSRFGLSLDEFQGSPA